MTVPPPPAVPGELTEKAARALNVAEFGEQSGFGPQERHRIAAEAVLAAVYGDIVEAARRELRAEDADLGMCMTCEDYAAEPDGVCMRLRAAAMSEPTGDEIAQAERIRRRATRIGGMWMPAPLIDPFRRCPHLHQRGIYGDEIITAGWKRARCYDCGRLLPNLPPKEAVERWIRRD